MASSAIAAMLDELMGRDRNLAPTEQRSEVRFEDPEVCKSYLVEFCPHELFTNTRADLGSCEKIHDEHLKKEYQKSARQGRLGYEEEFIRYLQSLITDVEKRIRRGHQRLALNSMQGSLNGNPANQKEDKVKMLTERINELVQQAEELGCEGKVEEAQGIMKLCDQLNEERTQLQNNPAADPYNEPLKAMEVCNVCGALLVVGDAQQRVDEHIMGKQHSGYARIRAYVEGKRLKSKEEEEERENKLRLEREEREKEREKEREERKKKEEEKRKEKEEKEKERKARREKEKEKEREKRKRSRSRSRSRRSSRSKDRKHRSRSRSRHHRRSRSRSKDRHRSSRRSHRSRSRDRDGKSKERRHRSRSKDRSKARSEGRSKDRSRDRSSKARSKDRSSKDRDRSSKDRERSSKDRDRSKDRSSKASSKERGDSEDHSKSSEKDKPDEQIDESSNIEPGEVISPRPSTDGEKSMDA